MANLLSSHLYRSWRSTFRGLVVLSISLCVVIAMSCKTNDQRRTPQAPPSVAHLFSDTPRLEVLRKRIPELDFYLYRLRQSLQQRPPVMTLDRRDLQDSLAWKAQAIALRNTQFTRWVYDTATRQPLRNEITQVRRALAGDLPPSIQKVCVDRCYLVEMYNYFYPMVSRAWVDPLSGVVHHVEHSDAIQPMLSPILRKIAVSLALTQPEVPLALGYPPNARDVLMEAVPSSLKNTACERSLHLCVAPTFVVDQRALWVIVDLTDFRVVGMKWTEVGSSEAGSLVTEKKLQDEVVMQRFCARDNDTTLGRWSLTYRLTPSDGLELRNARFGDRAVLASAKIVDWHVNYHFKEQFGYNDAMGCPQFSTAAVVAFNGPQFQRLRANADAPAGYLIVQDFQSPVWPKPCNYRYQNHFILYDDGSLLIKGHQMGRGCGTPGTYRPVFRIFLDQRHSPYHFEHWDGHRWVRMTMEGWHLQTPEMGTSPEGFLYRLINDDGQGYGIPPNHRLWGYGARGDSAYIYVTVHHPDEGDSNMPSFGSCCRTDWQQGPDKFLQPPERLLGKPIVLWFVPVLYIDHRPGREFCWATTVIVDGVAKTRVWPCSAGLYLVPLQ